MVRTRAKLFIILSVIVLASVYIDYIYTVFFQSSGNLEKYCRTDRDCSCGVRISTGDCFYGNKDFVDSSRQCPDFCNGIAANLVIKCANNECTQSVCRCPGDYIQEGNTCNPKCYYSNPRCLIPSIQCS
jgi:hypothetical protein